MTGCSYVSPDPALADLPDHSATILPEFPSAEAVSQVLGTPWLASIAWGVEVYRDARTQTEVLSTTIIPSGRLQDDIYRYTLVSYGADRTATATASGIHRKPSKWRMTQPIELKDLALFLQAGDFTFAAGWEDRHETLMISPAARDTFLAAAGQSSDATVVIGCGLHLCPAKLSIDGGPTLLIPYRLNPAIPGGNAPLITGNTADTVVPYPASGVFPIRDTIAAIRVSPGTHTLKSWGGNWQHGELAGLISGNGSVSFTGSAGEVIYIVIDVSAREFSWAGGAKDIRWDITSQSLMPMLFRDRPLIVYRGERWLIEPESLPSAAQPTISRKRQTSQKNGGQKSVPSPSHQP